MLRWPVSNHVCLSNLQINAQQPVPKPKKLEPACARLDNQIEQNTHRSKHLCNNKPYAALYVS